MARKIIRVPQDYASIQEAINASVGGEVILVGRLIMLFVAKKGGKK